MRVTVYILNHNYAHYLEAAVESVLEQNYENIEILLIDDGSTDDSVKFIEKNYSSNPKITFIKNIESQGLIKCCNQALQLANGEVLMRLDADDFLEANAIDSLVNFFSRQKAKCQDIVAVFGDYFEIDQAGHKIREIRKQSDRKGGIDFLVPIHGACTLIDIQWLNSIGGYDNDFTRQDGFYIWAQASALGKQILGCSKVIFSYRKHQLSLSATWSKILDQRSLIARKIVTNQLNDFKYDVVLPIRAADVLDNLNVLKTICDLLKQRLIKSENIKKIHIVSSSECVFREVESHLLDFNVVFKKRSEESELPDVTLRRSLSEIKIFDSSAEKSAFALVLSVAATFVSLKDIELLLNQAVIFTGFDTFILGRIINGDIFQPVEGGLGELSESNRFSDEEHCFVERTPGVVVVRSTAWQSFVAERRLSVGLAESL